MSKRQKRTTAERIGNAIAVTERKLSRANEALEKADLARRFKKNAVDELTIELEAHQAAQARLEGREVNFNPDTDPDSDPFTPDDATAADAPAPPPPAPIQDTLDQAYVDANTRRRSA